MRNLASLFLITIALYGSACSLLFSSTETASEDGNSATDAEVIGLADASAGDSAVAIDANSEIIGLGCPSDDPALELCLSFDNRDGNKTVIDDSGNVNTAYINGTVSSVSGVDGEAGGFDGEDSFLRINDFANSSLNIPKEMTLETWFRLTDPDGEWSSLYLLDNQGQYSMQIQYASKNQIRVQCQLAIGSVFPGASHVIEVDSDWHHVACIRTIHSTGSTLAVYVDATTSGQPSDISSDNIPPNPAGIYIGANFPENGDETNSHFKGELDNLRIWSKALSTDSLTEIYMAGTPAL